MSANGLPTPDGTPGPDSDRITADKARQISENSLSVAKPSASAKIEQNALTTIPENGEKFSVQSKPSSEEVVEEDAPMLDVTSTDNTPQQRETVNRVIRAHGEGKYYDVLGLSPGCSKEEITSAYRKTAKLLHPDKSGDGDADENMKMVAQAYAVLKDDNERKKWEQDPQTYAAPGGKDLPSFEEEFHTSAFGNESLDRDEFLKKASPHVEKLLSVPTAPDAIKSLKAINDEIHGALQMSGESKKFNEVRIKWETIRDHAQIAQAEAGKMDTSPEGQESKLRMNKESLKKFIEREKYPDIWYQRLPPAEAPQKTRTDKADERPKQNATSAASVAALAGSSVYTKDNKPIVAYSNVGRGHQFIVKAGDSFELRSGAEIGFHIAESYLSLDEKSKIHLGEADSHYGRKDTSQYQGIFGVASKPMQTMTVGGSPRLPTAWVLAGFGDSIAPAMVWLTRTTLRKICGKASADEDIRNWYLDLGQTPVDDIPPKVEKRRLDAPANKGGQSIESLTEKLETLTQLVMLMHSQKQKDA